MEEPEAYQIQGTLSNVQICTWYAQVHLQSEKKKRNKSDKYLYASTGSYVN